jgi:microcystin-dependent protein
MAAHTHVAQAGGPPADQTTPAGFFWCDWGKAIYSAGPDSVMSPSTMGPVGGSQAHNNMSPYLALTFVIALTGIFPSRN